MYLTAADPNAAGRTWLSVLQSIIDTKVGPTRERWAAAGKQPAVAAFFESRLLDTRAEHMLPALKAGTVSTNVYLRRLHNFAVDMGWVTAPVLHRRQWPKTRFKPKRAITLAEPSTNGSSLPRKTPSEMRPTASAGTSVDHNPTLLPSAPRTSTVGRRPSPTSGGKPGRPWSCGSLRNSPRSCAPCPPRACCYRGCPSSTKNTEPSSSTAGVVCWASKA